MSTIRIALSAANMDPNATEADFDAWATYICDHIDEATGLVCEVDQAAFTGRGAEAEDRIEGATDEQREAIRGWLSVTGWEAFCADAGARPDEDASDTSVQAGSPDGFAS